MFSSTFFFFLLQTSFKKVSFVINLNPIEDLFQLVEDELLMKLTTLEEGTKGIITPPLSGDFSVPMDWNTTLSQVDFQFKLLTHFFSTDTFLSEGTNHQTSTLNSWTWKFGFWWFFSDSYNGQIRPFCPNLSIQTLKRLQFRSR